MLGRMPALVLIFSVLQGATVFFTAGLVALTCLPVALFYRFFMNVLAEERAEREKKAARAAKA